MPATPELATTVLVTTAPGTSPALLRTARFWATPRSGDWLPSPTRPASIRMPYVEAFVTIVF